MQRGKPGLEFQQILKTFPSSVRESLQNIQRAGGMLSSKHCLAVLESLNISAEDLMLRLLPVAKLYGATAISDFQVGAVAKARISDNADEVALFLGANIEFPAQVLTQTIHAEQSAVINAWLRGAKQIDAIAVTAAPCGHCRQFLYELEGSHKLTVIFQNPDPGEVAEYKLTDLLPQAFGPHQLGMETGLTAPADQQPDLTLQSSPNDSFVLEAMAAAKKSYAPHSKNYAGCAIQTVNGKMYTGRYAENAAFNPSLSPLHTAIIRMSMDNLESDNKITRAVLVEIPTSISQRAISDILIKTVAPGVNLEYFEAV